MFEYALHGVAQQSWWKMARICVSFPQYSREYTVSCICQHTLATRCFYFTLQQEDVVSVAGRIVNKREQGKLLFYTIKADGAKVQIMSSLGEHADGEEAFWKLHGLLRRGDLIGATGFAGKSKKGELSVFPTSMQLLAPCLHMLPRMGLKNQEVRR